MITKKLNSEFKKGDIVIFEQNMCNDVRKKSRPWVIVSNNAANMANPTINIVPLTTNLKARRYSTVLLKGGNKNSLAVVSEIMTISKYDCKVTRGHISDEDIAEIDKKLLMQLAL